MPQLQAAYCIEGIKEILAEKIIEYFPDPKMNELWRSLSYFELDTKVSLEQSIYNCNPIFLVACNIIMRGLPTRPSIFIEEVFSETFQFTKILSNEQVGSFKFDAIDLSKEQLVNFYRAFYIVDPRLNPKTLIQQFTKSWEKLESPYEEGFFHNVLPELINNSINQLVEIQRPLPGIVNNDSDFTQQKVDFSIEFPYAIYEKNGLIIEVDGPQHDLFQQKMLDDKRDKAAENSGWLPTFRIKTREFDRISQKIQRLKDVTNNDYFKIVEHNYKNGFSLNALEVILSPIAIARVQRTILEFIINGYLDLKNVSWDIIVLERDLSCAFLAIEDLKQLIGNLFLLKGEKNKLPDIKLTVINTNGFDRSKLGKKNECVVYNISNCPDDLICDLFIDISILQRPGFFNQTPAIIYDHFAEVRSVHSIKTKRKFKTGDLIKYREFATRLENGTYEFDSTLVKPLETFLKDFFRKTSFREGQLEILNKALQAETVIGLLPTGGGKSLTYQLASLLQPGITLIIDPIKSLMKDQNDGLKLNLIDAAVFINSSQKTAEEREFATNKLKYAEVLFCFISPERMQIAEFRRNLNEMHHKHASYFSYCVIDEAHCVSEWGHDFRTSYLRLGENARNFCKPKSGVITFFGLTATASFDVLTDVQRELEISDDYVVRQDPSNRPELNYKILQVNIDDIKTDNHFQLMQSVGSRKHSEILKIIKAIPSDLLECARVAGRNLIGNNRIDYLPDGFNKNEFFAPNGKNEFQNAGLIFCPHKSENINSGVDAVVNSLSKEVIDKNGSLKIGFFYGVDRDDSNTNAIVDQYQTDYKQNKLNLLVATKAYGMGIDKSNIRFTIHYNYPSSIESFIQEAGRAGRDKKTALNYILYSSNPTVDRSILESFFDNSFKGRDKEVFMLAELLTEITFPFSSITESIYTALESEFGIDVSISFYNKNGQNQLYVNESFRKGYGCIDFNKGWEINTKFKHEAFTIGEAQHLLNFTKAYILKNCKDPSRVIDWLKLQRPQPSREGIEKRLEKMRLNEEVELIIGFENDKLFLIQQLLSAIDDEFSISLIKKANKFCSSSIEFIANLKKEYWKIKQKSIVIPEKYQSKIASYFNSYREDSDTSRAIYRLSIIGVIDDYEIDYNSKTYKVKITKRIEDYYVERLRNYFSKYVSKQKTDRLIIKIYSGEAKGSTNIRKCLNLLTHFVYSEIVGKRKEAIKSMEFAVELGTYPNNPERMREHIQLYFNAKYLWGYKQDGIIYNLRDDTENGKDYNSVILWKYLKVTFGDVDNLKHLLGSAERLLNENRQNASLLLMKSFSLILLNVTPDGKIKNQKFINQAEETFTQGLYIFSEEKEEYESIKENFKNQLIEFNRESASVINEFFESLDIKQIYSPLRDFNDKFLKKYETRKYKYSNKAN